jgi:hypothetical protein
MKFHPQTRELEKFCKRFDEWCEKIKKPKFKVGDNIQWVSQGQCQFRELKKVIKIDWHGESMEFYYFIEDSDTGFPESQVELAESL